MQAANLVYHFEVLAGGFILLRKAAILGPTRALHGLVLSSAILRTLAVLRIPLMPIEGALDLAATETFIADLGRATLSMLGARSRVTFEGLSASQVLRSALTCQRSSASPTLRRPWSSG